MVWWVYEIIIHGRFKKLKISFLVPGHRKFEPYLLLSTMTNKFPKADVFSTKEIVDAVISHTVTPHVLEHDAIRNWKYAGHFVSISGISAWSLLVFNRALS